jgi:hypothetical protein
VDAVPEEEARLDAFLDTLKWDEKGLVVAIAQASLHAACQNSSRKEGVL